MNEVPLTFGIDFEIARERLAEQVGVAARRVMALKADPAHSAEALEAARVELDAAQKRLADLRPEHVLEIAALRTRPS